MSVEDKLLSIKSHLFDNSDEDIAKIDLRVYSFGNGGFKMNRLSEDVNGVVKSLNNRVPFDEVGDLVNFLLLDDLKWNVLEAQFFSDGNIVHKLYWDEEKEAIEKAPIDDPEGREEVEAVLLAAQGSLAIDISSEQSITPWYFVKDTNSSIHELVRKMCEEGSELDVDDLDAFDFTKDQWKEIDENIKTLFNSGVELRIRVDAHFEEETFEILAVLFMYSVDGVENVIEIKDY